MTDQQFCLRWNNHQSTLISVFDTLLGNETLVDCTLAAEGQYINAHKVVLCACSPYLHTLLSRDFGKHPIVILKDVKFSELKCMVDYMYKGEVNICHDELATFLKAAELLQIKGLSDRDSDGDTKDVGPESNMPIAQPVNTRTYPILQVQQPSAESSTYSMSNNSSISTRKRRMMRNSPCDYSVIEDDFAIRQTTPTVPIITASSVQIGNSSTTATSSTIKAKQSRTQLINRDSSIINALGDILPESRMIKEVKTEPIETLLEPKTEYLGDDYEDIVEDLTLDDDDMERIDTSNMIVHMSQTLASRSNDLPDIFNREFPSWQTGENQSRSDTMLISALNANQDSPHRCNDCGRSYKHKTHLNRHQRLECGKEPQFHCPHCPHRSKQKTHLKTHIVLKHNDKLNDPSDLL